MNEKVKEFFYKKFDFLIKNAIFQEKVKKLIKNIFIPLLEIESKTIEYNEHISKEDRIVKIVSKIEHSIFDKNYTYFANPNKEQLPEQEINEKPGIFTVNTNEENNRLNEENESIRKEDIEKLKGGQSDQESKKDSLDECLVKRGIFHRF